MDFNWTTVQEVVETWGISDKRVQILFTNEKVKNARRLKRGWFIPKDIQKPADR